MKQTIVTLDIVQRGVGRNWSEERLVAVGRWSGGIALLIGALFAPVVMKWESLFRYAQDIWAMMAAPVVVVFLCAALYFFDDIIDDEYLQTNPLVEITVICIIQYYSKNRTLNFWRAG